jgi:NAD(P)-binding Rossmann-like domain
MVHSLSGISVISLSWKLAIAAGHRESDSRRSGCRSQKPLAESYTIRLKTKPRFRLLSRGAATKRSASSTQRETWVTKITDEHNVVVVGAGAAGIAATRRLIEAGVDVLLLEARNRVGGRALSVRQGNGVAIDLECGCCFQQMSIRGQILGKRSVSRSIGHSRPGRMRSTIWDVADLTPVRTEPSFARVGFA